MTYTHGHHESVLRSHKWRTGGLWADRMTDSAIARQAVTEGLATEEELRGIADGWRRWATHPDAWYVVLHGEILCHA